MLYSDIRTACKVEVIIWPDKQRIKLAEYLLTQILKYQTPSKGNK